MTTKPSVPQTSYTIGGRDISNQAVPLLEENLDRQNAYLDNLWNRTDPYMRYADLNVAANQSMFMDEYLKNMGSVMDRNYSTLGGGYSSAGDSQLDRTQDFYNALATDLYSNQVGLAEQMAMNEWNAMVGANSDFINAYNLGQAYSDVERYNATKDGSWWDQWSEPITGGLTAIGKTYSTFDSSNLGKNAQVSPSTGGGNFQNVPNTGNASSLKVLGDYDLNGSQFSNNDLSIWDSAFDGGGTGAGSTGGSTMWNII